MHEEEEKTSNQRSYSRKNNHPQTAEEVRITNHIFCNKLPLHTEQVLLMSYSKHPLDRSLLWSFYPCSQHTLWFFCKENPTWENYHTLMFIESSNAFHKAFCKTSE